MLNYPYEVVMDKDVSKILKEWRRQYNVTQTKAAKILGVPVRTIQNWEQKHRVPSKFIQANLDLMLRFESVTLRRKNAGQ